MRAIVLDSEGAWLSEVSLSEAPYKILSLLRLEKATDAHFAILPVVCQGFYDSHMHPSWIAKLKNQIDCRGKSTQSIVDETLKSSSKIIYGFGWDEDSLASSLADFEKALKKIPKKITLFRICNHLAFDSELGFLKDDELDKLPLKELRENDLKEVMNEIRSVGIDESAELFVPPSEVPLIKKLSPEQLLFGDAKDLESFGQKSGVTYMKYFLDGSLGARTAWLSTEYSDQRTFGMKLWNELELRKSVEKSLAAGYLVAFHAIGDAALDQLLNLGENLQSELQQSLRENFFHRIEHLQVCRDDQIERLQKQRFWSLGLQPSHRVADEKFSRLRLGELRLQKNGYRLKSFLDAGLKISLGSDAPIVAFDPKLNFHAIESDARKSEKIPLSEIYKFYCVAGRQNAGKSAKELCQGSDAWLSTLAL